MVAQDGLQNKHLLLFHVLQRFGLDASMDTFEKRLRKQKLLAWLNGEGINLGYDFSWYVKGPYSPSLTADLFLLAKDENEAKQQLKTRKIGEALDAQLVTKKDLLGDLITKPLEMEAIGSIGYYKNRGFDKTKISATIKARKPHLASQIDIDQLVDKFG